LLSLEAFFLGLQAFLLLVENLLTLVEDFLQAPFGLAAVFGFVDRALEIDDADLRLGIYG
jgi:hypothetical protein